MSIHNAYKKRREIAVIGVESAPGVVATTSYAFRWLNKNVDSKAGILENESGIGLNARVNDSAIDTWHSEGPLGGKVTEEGFGFLANGMFNKVTTKDNADGTFTHTFERDESVARKTLSYWDVRPAGVRLFKSLYMDNLNLNIEVGDAGAWLESSTAFKGWKHEDVASYTPPAFAVDEKEFTSRHVKILLADDEAGLLAPTALVKARSFDWSTEESVTVDHYLGETGAVEPEFDSAPYETKGSMVVKYRKTDFEDSYFSNKRHAMKIIVQNDDAKIEIIGTNVYFPEVTDSDGRDDTVTQTINYFFLPDLAKGGKDVIVKVTNKIASYTA